MSDQVKTIGTVVGAGLLASYGLFEVYRYSALKQQTKLSDRVSSKSLDSDSTNQIITKANNSDSLQVESFQALETKQNQKVISDLAYLLSDLVFVYSDGTKTCFGANVADLSASSMLNVDGKVTTVKKLSVRNGAGAAVLGALQQHESNQRIAVLTTSEALTYMIPSLHAIAASGKSCVIHVAVNKINDDLTTNYDINAIHLARSAGFVVMSSHNTTNTYQSVVAAHALQARKNLPVIHFFDNVHAGQVLQQVPQLPLELIKTAIKRSDSEFSILRSVDDNVTAVFDDLRKSGFSSVQAVSSYGHPSAAAMLVCFGLPMSVILPTILEAHAQGKAIGVVNVSLFRPLPISKILENIPDSCRRIYVIEPTSKPSSPLFQELIAGMYMHKRVNKPSVGQLTVSPSSEGLSPRLIRCAIEHLFALKFERFVDLNKTDSSLQEISVPHTKVINPSYDHIVVFGRRQLMLPVAEYFAQEVHEQAHIFTKSQMSTDELAPSPLTRFDLLASKTQNVPEISFVPVSEVIVESFEVALECSTSLVQLAEEGAQITILSKNMEDLEDATTDIKFKIASVVDAIDTVDLETIAINNAVANEDAFVAIVKALSSKRIYRLVDQQLQKSSISSSNDLAKSCLRGHEAAAALFSVVDSISALSGCWTVPKTWKRIDNSSEETESHSTLQFAPRVAVNQEVVSSKVAKQLRQHEVAWNLIFDDAFKSESGTRPGSEGVYKVRLTKNQRLTPEDYHRNIFHLEMDITNTGLTYEIGDALGVFGHNNREEVDEFLNFYDLNPNDVVAIKNENDPTKDEVLTVAQLFEQRLDLFGKPSQQFYDALAPHAKDGYQQAKLEWLGTDDKEGFKLRQLETVTYADVLREFSSAQPPLVDLIAMIPPIKPRHYSIASSMKMNPNSVHLLVVLVDWTTPKGRQRFGQCTRYLANLDPTKDDDIFLTVDIKPSAMHLPPSPKQPVIMAGLGTGMAPFRAFLQEREWQRQQGIEVGPMVLYFGSRHRSEEYLYGEELDQYYENGLITRLGLAFSRDQPEKVYIQHKIMEDKKMLKEYLSEEKGHFYLCGPTWPVPDVKNAICQGLIEEAGMTEEEASDYIEELKEQERYVLEVY